MFLNDFFDQLKSLNADAVADALIGPISGEISMAPMITAAEFMLRRRTQLMMANINTHSLAALEFHHVAEYTVDLGMPPLVVAHTELG